MRLSASVLSFVALLSIARLAHAHDCSSAEDCQEVVKNQAWISAALALGLVWLSKRKKQAPECSQLEAALKDSKRVQAAYQAYLEGDASYEEVTSSLQEIGNAATGVSGSGKSQPPIVKQAIAEVEAFDFGEEGVQVLSLLWATMQPGDTPLLRKKAEVEIKRQEHFDTVLRRLKKDRGC